MTGEEFREIFLPRLLEDREIAAVHHVHVERARRGHQEAEFTIELRRPAGDVERSGTGILKEREHVERRLPVHLFLASRTGVDVTVQAALITPVADVDLQSFEPPAAKPGKVGRLET